MTRDLDPKLLRRIMEVTATISETRQLSEILTGLVEKGTQIVGAERGTVFLFDRGSGRLRQMGFTGAVDPQVLDIAPGEGIAGSVFTTGRAIRSNEPYKDPRFFPVVDVKTGFRTLNILTVPLRGPNNETIGVLQFLNKRSGGFDDQDEAALDLLAVQAAIIIANAQHIEETERQKNEIERESTQLTKALSGNIVGESKWTSDFRDLAERLAESPINILITGESGSGKSHIAKHLHYTSQRSRKPFIALNCAAIPDTLLESELFGIESGVATGVQKKRGKIELADQGCLFLDEIGDLSLQAQAKILQVIQEKTFFRVGGRTPILVDVRLLSATNKDLDAEIKGGRFRQDLYFRLNVLNIHIPPLRDRPEDIPPLVEETLQRACYDHNKSIHGLAPETLSRLLAYSWPGNVRELENEIMRMVALAPRNARLGPECLSPKITREAAKSSDSGQFRALKPETSPPRVDSSVRPESAVSSGPNFSGFRSLPQATQELEIYLIQKVLAETSGQKSKAAEILEISRESLRQKMKKFGIED